MEPAIGPHATYVIPIAEDKQADTRERRVAEALDMLREGRKR